MNTHLIRHFVHYFGHTFPTTEMLGARGSGLENAEAVVAYVLKTTDSICTGDLNEELQDRLKTVGILDEKNDDDL